MMPAAAAKRASRNSASGARAWLAGLRLPSLAVSAAALPLIAVAGMALAQETSPQTPSEASSGAPAQLATPIEAAPDAAGGGETIIAHGISTFGDLKYAADFEHLDYVNPDAPKGGELSVWAPGGFDSFNPFTRNGRAAALSSIMFEPLMEGTADEQGSAYCLLCSQIEYPADRSWVIFTLRPEARFSDGSPLTAEDVKFSFDLLSTKGLSSFRAILSRLITSVEVLDPQRLKFTFAEDQPPRDRIQTVGGLVIFSKADYEGKGRDLEASSMEPFIGSGPYRFGAQDVGRRVVWERNPDYWGKDLALNRGRHNFDRLRIEYFADYETAFEGFKAGAYTFRNEASSLIWATRYDFPALTRGHVVKRELPDGTIASGQAFVMNLRREKFQDIRVREALGLMFNFEWSNKTLFYGLYSRVNSVWENSDLAAQGLPEGEELALLTPLAADLPEGALTETAVMAPVSGEQQLDRRAMRQAAALLDAAGWVTGSDGLRRNAAGQPLRVEFLNDSQTFDRVINPYVDNLRKLGVDAVHTRVDDAQMTTRERAHDFDIITDQLGQGYIPGAGLQQYFGSQSTDDVFNSMGLANPAVDALITSIEGADTQEQLQLRVRALDRALRSLRFWIPQWYKAAHTVAYYDMYEHPETLPPYALGEMDFWWYNAEKAEKLRAAGAF